LLTFSVQTGKLYLGSKKIQNVLFNLDSTGSFPKELFDKKFYQITFALFYFRRISHFFTCQFANWTKKVHKNKNKSSSVRPIIRLACLPSRTRPMIGREVESSWTLLIWTDVEPCKKNLFCKARHLPDIGPPWGARF